MGRRVKFREVRNQQPSEHGAAVNQQHHERDQRAHEECNTQRERSRFGHGREQRRHFMFKINSAARVCAISTAASNAPEPSANTIGQMPPDVTLPRTLPLTTR